MISARRALAAVVAAMAVALLAPAVAGPAAGHAAPVVRQTEASQEGMQLASQSPWVTPEGEFALRLALDDDLLGPDRELAVTVYQRLTSRSAFALTLENVFVGSALDVTAAPVSELTRDAAGHVHVRLPVRSGAQPVDPAGPDRLLLRREGVYPVRVEVRLEGGDRVLAQLATHLVRLPAANDVRPLAVAWIQPLSASPAHATDGRAAVPDDGRARLDRVLEGLAAAEGVPLTVVPVPETLEALAASAEGGAGGEGGAGSGAEDGAGSGAEDGAGDGADGQDVRDAERLAEIRQATAGRQVVAGPWMPLSVPALAGAGLVDELIAHVTRGEDALVAHLELRPDRRTWVADGAVDERSIVELRRLGVQRLVIPGGALAPVDLPLTVTRPFEVEGAPGRAVDAVAADEGLADHFPGDRLDDPALRAHHLLADLAVLYFDLPGVQRGVAVAPPARWQPSARFLATAVHGLESAPILEAVTVDELFEKVPRAERNGETLVRELADDQRPRLGIPPTAVRAARARLAGYASLAAATSPVRARAEVPLLLATAGGLSGEDRRRYLDGANEVLDDELARIVAPDRQGITLTAREGSIPLTFQNLTGHPASIHVDLDSDKLEFPNGSTRDVRLDQRNTTIEVPVRTRTSGAFPLRITVTSPDGRLVVSRTRVTVRSTAVSGVGLFVTLGAGVFLAGWWGRHLRDGRRARRLVGRR